MKKPRAVIPDWLIGGAVTLLLLAAFAVSWWPLESMEMKLYDLRARLRMSPQVGQDIAIVAIDEESVQTLGRWPWPRTRMAEVIDILSEAGAKVIGLTILFPDPELVQGLAEIQTLKKSIQEAAQQNPKFEPVYTPILQAFTDIEKKLDNDSKLADSLALASNVVLPVYFEIGSSLGRPEGELAPDLLKHFVTQVDNANAKGASAIVETGAIKPPIEKFTKETKSLGHLNVTPDRDGVYRNHLLLVDYYGQGQYFPSFSTQLVATYWNLQPKDVRVRMGGGVQLGKVFIPTDASFKMMVNYNGPMGTFRYYPIVDVLNRKVQAEAFKGKIVIIGLTHLGLGEQISTPVAPRLPQPEVIANVAQNILDQRFITRPPWARNLELGLLILFGAFISLVLPRLGAGKSAIIAVVLMAAFLGAGVYLFVTKGWWIKLLYPTLMLGFGYAAIISKKYLITEKHKEVLEVESAETNKMLGLSFQGQGMLDLALEKFRRCPVDEVKEELYNLGLDFERKRQFNKAVSVYQHIASKLPKFKDIEARIPKLTAAGETMVMGTAGLKRGGGDSTVLVQGADLKPTLGRYEILKELGKGAMGTVFLGKDPKINRMVAIKTLRFDEDLDPEDQKALKERFFREAESAGRLSHPNIVTIYDTGEDQDMCYIAMELLDGRDLKDWTTKDKLFPLPTAGEHIAKVAEALEYAHEQGIVHRDIKPANIMLLKNGVIKVTDFGIARITASSRTATGTVMGTPSYMSPEQLAGKKVDGRSDLFSLGVTLYELLTGEKPFQGESIATLMFKIANERHESPRQYNASVPEGLVNVIDKALAKNPDERYQGGKEMAAELRAALSAAGQAAAKAGD